jgi:hypothetical protein
MRWWLLVMVAVAGAGCATTTTVAFPASDGAQRALVENASSDASIETTDLGSDEPEIVVVASSPNDLRFDTRDDMVVPMTPVRRPSSIRPAVHQGMIIGAVIGVALGAMSGYHSDENQRAHPEASCDPNCGAGVLLGAPILGAVGLGLGAAVGAVVGLLGR